MKKAIIAIDIPDEITQEELADFQAHVSIIPKDRFKNIYLPEGVSTWQLADIRIPKKQWDNKEQRDADTRPSD